MRKLTKQEQKLIVFSRNPDLALHDDLFENNELLQALIELFKGIDTSQLQYLKGDKGDDGRDANVSEIVRKVTALIPKPRDGKDAVINYERVVRDVLNRIPPPEDGKDAIVDYELIIRESISKIPKPKDGSPDTGQEIVKKINLLEIKSEWQIDAKHIKNLPQPQIINQYDGGGGMEYKAGVGITISGNNVISATNTSTYTDAMARAAISLTTTGTSGAATYNSSTGVLNIPTFPTYTGTTNRITITGSVIDISSSYVGQTSITTLGTITTGTWNASTIGVAYGGTGQTTFPAGNRLVVSNGTTAFSSVALPLVVANGGTGATTLTGILKGNGTSAISAATVGTDYATGWIDDGSANVYLTTSSRKVAIGGNTATQKLSVIGGKIDGGTYYATAGRVTLDLSAVNSAKGYAIFTYPNTGQFVATEENVAGPNDIFFQGVPVSNSYTYLEGYTGLGLIVGTGATTPIIFKPNRIEVGRINGVGLGLNGNTNPTAPIQIGVPFFSGLKTYTASGSNEGLLINGFTDLSGTYNYRRFADFIVQGDQDGTNGGGIFRFLTNPRNSYTVSERMRIDDLGNVGIGTATPTSTLHSGGSSAFKNIISSAASLTLDSTATYWVFTGTTSTWTLPAVASFTDRRYVIKNRGSGNLTISSATGSQIYSTSAQATITVAAGSAVELVSDGTYFNVY